MKKMLRPILFATATCALLAGCAQPPPPVQALPPGPTPAEVIDYTTAQAQYRAANASGNGDVVTHAENTFRGISQEILSRQDPGLVNAWEVCERYRVAAPHNQRDVRSTFESQVVRFFDRKRNVLVYVAYSDRLIEGSPKNSISSVPIMAWPEQ